MFGRFISIILAGVFFVALSGCNQIMGGMPDRMARMNQQVDDMNSAIAFTNQYLEKSVAQLDEVEKHQTYAGSVAIVMDRKGEIIRKLDPKQIEDLKKEDGDEIKLSNFNIRVRLAQVLFAVSDVGIEPPLVIGTPPVKKHREDQIYELIGALGPLKFPALDLQKDRLGFVRNVSIVSSDPVRDSATYNIPIDQEIYQVFAHATTRMLRKLSGAVSDGVYDQDILRERALNLFYIGTAVIGAADGTVAAAYGTDTKVKKESYYFDLAVMDPPVRSELATTDPKQTDKVEELRSFKRRQAANEMIALRAALSMDNMIPETTLKMLIANRMGDGLLENQNVEKLK